MALFAYMLVEGDPIASMSFRPCAEQNGAGRSGACVSSLPCRLVTLLTLLGKLPQTSTFAGKWEQWRVALEVCAALCLISIVLGRRSVTSKSFL